MNQHAAFADALIYNDREAVKIFKTASGPSYKLLSNDTLNEDYFTFTLLKQFGSRYQVLASSIRHQFNGYIKLDNLGVYTRPIDFMLRLYVSPNRNTNFKIYKQEDGIMARILQVKGLWLKVSFINEKKLVIGWLSYEYQCANPYTTCN